MKHYHFALLFSLSLLWACSGDPQKKSASATAEAFLSALYDGDFEQAKKYCTPESQKTIGLLEGLAEMGGGMTEEDKKDFEIVREEESGNYATVYFTEDDQPDEETLKLKKTSGKWEVMFTKSALGAGSEDPEVNEELEEGLEEIGEGMVDVVTAIGKGIKEGVENMEDELREDGFDVESDFDLEMTPGHKYRKFREGKNAEEIAEAFLTAMNYNDEVTALRYASEQTADLLKMSMNGGSKYDNFQILDTELDGDYAKVSYTLPSEGVGTTHTLKLRKDSYGNWEVLMTKDDQ